MAWAQSQSLVLIDDGDRGRDCFSVVEHLRGGKSVVSVLKHSLTTKDY